jgi:hypothetical protein
MDRIGSARAWLRKEMGHSWLVLVGFLALSGLIGVFSSIRAIIELFSLMLMGVYRLTDPWLEPWLEGQGIDNRHHVASNLILYGVLSLILTGVFVWMRHRRIVAGFEQDDRAAAARRKAQALDEAAAGGAVGGGLLGGLAGAALGLVFAPVALPLLAVGVAAGGLSGAAAQHDETLMSNANQPDITPEQRRIHQRKATRVSARVLASTLTKAMLICLAIGLMTYQRSPGWNLAREMELRTEWGLAWVACKLQPEDTFVLEMAPVDRSVGGRQRNLCMDGLATRRADALAQIKARDEGDDARD